MPKELRKQSLKSNLQARNNEDSFKTFASLPDLPQIEF